LGKADDVGEETGKCTLRPAGIRAQASWERLAEITSGSCATSAVHGLKPESVRNYTEDEGRPFEAALQGEASNHLKLLWPKAMVVSVEEKAHKMCQVWIKKMSESEPRMTCRNVKDDIKTRVVSRSWDELGRYLLTVRAVSGIHVA
jgi:hypothetical protein